MATDIRGPIAGAGPPRDGTAQQARHRTRSHASSHHGVRGALITLEAFQAATAIPSAIFVVPTMPREVLLRGPLTLFSGYTVPALALGVLCGGGALAALGAVVARPKLGALVSIAAGLAMTGFEVVQIAAIGLTAPQTPADPRSWLQEVYLAVGGAIAILGARLWKAETGSYRLTW